METNPYESPREANVPQRLLPQAGNQLSLTAKLVIWLALGAVIGIFLVLFMLGMEGYW